MSFEQKNPEGKAGNKKENPFDTFLKISERVEVLARETTQFIQSVERLTPTEKKSPSFKTIIEEGYNIFSLGKAKIERIKRDLEDLK